MKLFELMTEKPDGKDDEFGMYTAMHRALRLSPLERTLRLIKEIRAEKEKSAAPEAEREPADPDEPSR